MKPYVLAALACFAAAPVAAQNSEFDIMSRLAINHLMASGKIDACTVHKTVALCRKKDSLFLIQKKPFDGDCPIPSREETLPYVGGSLYLCAVP